jgi:hypothetical protein
VDPDKQLDGPDGWVTEKGFDVVEHIWLKPSVGIDDTNEHRLLVKVEVVPNELEPRIQCSPFAFASIGWSPGNQMHSFRRVSENGLRGVVRGPVINNDNVSPISWDS